MSLKKDIKNSITAQSLDSQQKTLAESWDIGTPDTISEVIEDDASRRMGDTSVYMYYISAVGWIPTLIFIVCICAFVVCYSYPAVWVKKWAEANSLDPNGRVGYYLGIYAAIGGLALVSLVASAWQMIITMASLRLLA